MKKWQKPLWLQWDSARCNALTYRDDGPMIETIMAAGLAGFLAGILGAILYNKFAGFVWLCSQNTCEELAVCYYYWPGQLERKYACSKHEKVARATIAAMGFGPLQCTDLPGRRPND